MSETPEAIMRKMLRSFEADPPDDEYQQGFLDALVVFATEGMGWNLVRETNAKRRRFEVIDGGKGGR